MNEPYYDDQKPLELSPGVFHLGVKDNRNSWANIPYLVVDGDEAVLIDPGSAIDDFYATLLRKLHHALGDLRRIKHIVVQHQDPDLCAAIAPIEKLLSPDVKVVCPLESRLLVEHYGFKAGCVTVNDGDTLRFGNGRELTFIMTPYAHFIGSMVTYDSRTKTVFSSDAFGGFSVEDDVFATDDYPEFLTTFLGQYLGSKRALDYALKRLEGLASTAGIAMICPQHGQVIPASAIPVYMKAAAELRVGDEIDRLCAVHGIELDWVEVRRDQVKEGKEA